MFEESSYPKFWDVNNLHGWAMPQKLHVNDLKIFEEWVEDISGFNEDFIKRYNDESDEGYFLKVDVQYHKSLHLSQLLTVFAWKNL